MTYHYNPVMVTLWHSLRAYKLSPQLSFAMHVHVPPTRQVVLGLCCTYTGGGVHAGDVWGTHTCMGPRMMCGVWHTWGPCAHAWGWAAHRGHTCMHRHTRLCTHAQGLQRVGAEKVSHHCYNLSPQVAVKTRDREIK